MCPSFRNLPPSQPHYPVVMPIWISEADDKFLVDLIAELNMSEGACAGSSHPVSALAHTIHHIITLDYCTRVSCGIT